MMITKKLVENLLELSKAAYPNEVAGLLLSEKGIANDFVLMPGIYDNYQVTIYTHMLPIYHNAIGTFHSHPTSNNLPSKADKRFFTTRGKCHLIIGYPYTADRIAAYDTSGKKSSFEVV
jgi:proteasome lid subunit RPN8/RPN11